MDNCLMADHDRLGSGNNVRNQRG